MKVIDNFTNKNGVDITIFDDDRIYCKAYIDDDVEVEYTFIDENELINLTDATIETIDVHDLIEINELENECPDFEEFDDVELE